VFSNTLYFRAIDGSSIGWELWQYDGVNATLAVDINPGGGSYPARFAVYSDVLFFEANDGTYGYELWQYDGMTATRITDITPGSGSSDPNGLVVFEDALYFFAEDGAGGYGEELWRYDGVTVTLAADINPSETSGYEGRTDPVVFRGALHFGADDGTRGAELWKLWTPKSVYLPLVLRDS
jgi:ELWxxDGT repeat protein